MRQYCFGIGAPVIKRVSGLRRVRSPPARTIAQSRELDDDVLVVHFDAAPCATGAASRYS
jgi:hypothetical protein